MDTTDYLYEAIKVAADRQDKIIARAKELEAEARWIIESYNHEVEFQDVARHMNAIKRFAREFRRAIPFPRREWCRTIQKFSKLL